MKSVGPKSISRQEGYQKALDLLQKATTPHGILASPDDTANYRRVWARDGVICGLAGLLIGNEALTAGLKATLTTLIRTQGPDGQIASNVKVAENGDILDVSYGRICGRVDTISWFVIGACQYLQHHADGSLAGEAEPAMQRGLDLLTAWEFNRRGLIYVPQSGNWADEYILHGYVLYDQLLRLWALRCHAEVTGAAASRQKAALVQELIEYHYWAKEELSQNQKHIHPRAYEQYFEAYGPSSFWLSGFAPGGYFTRFDAFANALAALLELGSPEQQKCCLEHGNVIASSLATKLVPAFWPPITESDPEWRQLRTNYAETFRNMPCEYHNGGVWPMVNGWWGMALCKAGFIDEAHGLLNALYAFNYQSEDGSPWGFYEYGNAITGAPGGTKHLAWSAAAVILLEAALSGASFW